MAFLKGTPKKTANLAGTFQSVGAQKELMASGIQTQEANFKTLSPRDAYQMSIPLHHAITCIVEQICKTSWHLLTENGDTIESGEAYEFCRKNITKQFIRECITNWLLEGEIACLTPFQPNSIRPEGLLVLDPGFLRPMPPTARSLEFVEYWYYYFGWQVKQNTPVINIPANQLAFVKNFNPNNYAQAGIRGLSPAIVGSQQISGSYFAARFNNAFHQNGHHADLAMVFPEGTNPDEAKSAADLFSSRHSNFRNNAFKMMAIIGDQFEVKELGQTEKEGNFLKLSDYNDNSVYELYGVPPIISGRMSNATYDNASDIQYKAFYENTLCPVIEVFNDFIQTQIIEPYFTSASNTMKSQKKLSRALRKSIEHYSGFPIVFRIDPETLPVASELRVAQIEMAAAYRTKLGVSFKDAAELANIDRPSNAVNDFIFISNQEQSIGHQEPTTLKPPVVQVSEEDEGLSTEDEQPALTPEEQKTLKKLLIRYRAELIRQASTGTLRKQPLIDITKENPALLRSSMQDYLIMLDLFKAEKPVTEVKAYLNNTYSNRNLKYLS